MTLAMIETKTAMAIPRRDQAVPGIDVLFVGPSDLPVDRIERWHGTRPALSRPSK